MIDAVLPLAGPGLSVSLWSVSGLIVGLGAFIHARRETDRTRSQALVLVGLGNIAVALAATIEATVTGFAAIGAAAVLIAVGLVLWSRSRTATTAD